MRALRLKKNEERRLRAGHLWVFSNEVDVAETPLTDFEPGEAVEIQARGGKPLGTGYVNPASLICARMCSRDRRHPFDESLLVHRIKVALSLRERLYDEDCYRLLNGEGDLLPGLVVDRYGDWLVVQITTAGIERLRDAVVAALVKVLSPRGVLLRNDAAVRELEGLPRYVEVAHGEVPECVELHEGGLRFSVDLHAGQKTGWFYDQRDNRFGLRRLCAGKRVLDLYSYVGGWGLNAAAGGASEVTLVDSSVAALGLAAQNAAANGFAERVRGLCEDAPQAMRGLRDAGEKFDVVVLDPPAFIKRKRNFKAGLQGYHAINRQAMQLLARDGILVSCSCSHHMPRERLQRVLLDSARHLDRSLQLLQHGHQSADHPIHPAIAESDYLKVLTTRVLPA